mmetsp:Transcript_29530/g.28710  ORF Transcript_29530/g.28710 Transcript_29530/m.28710 type:complete len:101 (-) Transcript_29530:4661-4963(-)
MFAVNRSRFSAMRLALGESFLLALIERIEAVLNVLELLVEARLDHVELPFDVLHHLRLVLLVVQLALLELTELLVLSHRRDKQVVLVGIADGLLLQKVGV